VHEERGRTVSYLVRSLLICVGTLAFLISSSALAAPLSPQEVRGKYIYDTGKSPSGRDIKAYFGRDLIEIPGERATCTSCHGYDGTGRPESGVIPTNITWTYLTKQYGHIHPDGLEHGVFSEESLREYMYTGFYPGGEKGDPSMPLYLMTEGDLDDLIAYLKKLGTYLDPGISEERIRIGTVVPSEGPAAEIGNAMMNTIAAFFDDINGQGGVYNRKVELVKERVSDKSPLTKEQLKQALRGHEIFAQVATFTPGFDQEMYAASEEELLPLVGPFTLFPLESLSLNRYVFYVLSGLREQAVALLEYTARSVAGEGPPRVAVIYPGRKDVVGIVDAVEEHCRAKGWEHVSRLDYAAGGFDADAIVERLKTQGAAVVVSLGGEAENVMLLKSAQAKGWNPRVLLPGVLMGKGISEIPKVFKERLFLAYPTLPEDRKEWAVAEFSGLMKKHNLQTSHVAAQISAYSSAKILVEGLKRAGREVNRERFLSALESLFEFETGLTPRITYNRNRRIGALGAYVVTVDPESADVRKGIIHKGWVSLD
jgi:ABC-type branched-subunit amino acid transport system substrate-binding protein